MQNSRKLVELEALRGIAAIIVLVHHFMLAFTPRLHGLLYTQQPHSLSGTPAFALVNGSAAVVLFFVLSGFVLALGVLRSETVSVALVAALKRWPRLVASVLTVNICAGILMAVGGFANSVAALKVPSVWLGWFYGWPSAGPGEVRQAAFEGATTFFTGQALYNSSLWTMFYEFWGSLLAIGCAAVLGWVPGLRGRVLVLAGVWVIVFALSPYFSTFIIGVALAMAHRRAPHGDWKGWPIWATLVLIILLAGYHENLASGQAEGWYAFLEPLVVRDSLSVRVILHTVAAVLAIALFLRVASLRVRFSGTIGRVLGFLSFPIYLTQVLVICSVSSWLFLALEDQSQLVRIALTFLVTIAATLLSAVPLAYLDRWWVARVNAAAAGLRNIASGQRQRPASL